MKQAMSFLTRKLLVAGLTLAAVFLASHSSPVVAQETNSKSEWTVMMYLDADCDLEACMMDDLKEMMAAGSTDKVRFVALIDRAASGVKKDGYSNEDIGGLSNWDTGKWILIEKGRLQVLEDWGKVNVGDSSTLVKFIEKTVQKFPANHYALTFGDHGASWPGVCSDESAGGDCLTTEEIASALKRTISKVGKLDLIGFDACLMANLEVAHSVTPYARIMVGSEESEPGDGWYYNPWMSSLSSNPGMSPSELGRLISDSYFDYFAKSPARKTRKTGLGVTFSVIDLEKAESLYVAVDNLAKVCQTELQTGKRASWLKIAQARDEAEEYGKSTNPKEPSSEVRDLGHFTKLLRQEFVSGNMPAALDAVEKSRQSAVIYSVHGKARPDAGGLSIFFPADETTLKSGDGLTYFETGFSKSNQWSPFLQSFVSMGEADNQAPTLAQVQTTQPGKPRSGKTVKTTWPILFSTRVNGDDVAEANFVLAGQEGKNEVIIGRMPVNPDASGTISQQWDGGWFTIQNTKNELICPISGFERLDEHGGYLITVPVEYKAHLWKGWRLINLYFYLTYDPENPTKLSGEFIYAFADTKFGPREIEILEKGKIRPAYLAIDSKGREILMVTKGKSGMLALKNNDLSIGYGKVPQGDYLVGFTATDFSDNTSEEYTQIQIP